MVLTAVLGLVTLFVGSIYAKEVRFIMKFPENMSLIKGDVIKMPITDYVQIKGASFSTNLSNPAFVIPSINYQQDIPLTPEADRCNLVSGYGSSQLIMVCNNKYFVRATMDHLGPRLETLAFAELTSSFVPALNQECSDMFINNGVAYVSCSDRSVSNNRDVVVYIITISSLSQASSRCKTNLKSSPRMTRISYDVANPSKFQLILYENIPLVDPNPGQISFSKCIIQENGNNTEGASESLNLAPLTTEDTLNATIRGISSINANEILFVLAESNSTVRRTRFAIVSVSTDGSLSKSKFTVSSWLPGSLGNTYDPKLIATSVVVNPSNTYIYMIGTSMVYRLTATFDRTTKTSEFTINIGIPAYNILDCGFASQADIYVGRVTTMTEGGIDSDNFRQLIEYRSKSSQQLKAFAIKFSHTNYGCSTASGTSSSKSLYGVAMTNVKQVIATGDDSRNLSYFKINRESFLNIPTASLTEGNVSIEISASLAGYDTSNQILQFTLTSDYRDQVFVNLQTKDIDVYANSTFGLPYISSNFIGNDLKFSTNSSNVIIQYTQSFNPKLIADLDGYNIDRIFSVDHDTFVAVLSKPGLPDRFITYFSQISGGVMTLQISSTNPIQKLGQGIFKIFKLGDDLYCMVFKGYSSNVKKLTMSCFEDKPDGATKLSEYTITDLYEVMDIQFLETKERVDFLMVGAVKEQSTLINKVIHFFVKLEVDGSIGTALSAKPIDIVHPALNSFYPVDALFDYVADLEGSNHVTIKMIADRSYPIIAKFNMSFDGDVVHLKYLRTMQLDNNDLAYCVNRNEAILFHRKTRQLYAQRFDRSTGIPSLNKYQFPLTSLGIQYVIQFLCIPEKGIFQILGVTANKEKYLVTYRGGESFNSGRRVHSMIRVDSSTSFIEHGYTGDYVVTVAGGSGGTDLNRTYVLIYPEGPKIYVDTTERTQNFSITLAAQTEKKKVEDIVNIRIINPTYTATAAVKNKFDFKAGTVVFMDDVATIRGPVLDVQLQGDTKGLESILLTKRNNRHKGVNIGDPEQPDRILVKRDFMVVLKSKKYVKFFGDPTVAQNGAISPKFIMSKGGNYRDLAITNLDYSDDVAVVTKEFLDGEYVYMMHIMRKLKDVDGKDVFIHEISLKVWNTKEDFEDIQLTTKEEDIVFAVRSKKKLISNYIRLVLIKKKTEGYTVAAAANVIPHVERLIDSYSLIYIGSNSVAILACSEGIIGLQATIWDTNAKQLVLVDTRTNLLLEDNSRRNINVDYLKCWKNFGNMTVQCVFDAEGVTDYVTEVTFNPQYEINGQDYVASMRVLKSFQMPPFFKIKKVSRVGQMFTILVEKNIASKVFSKRRVLQSNSTATIDKFSECNNLILSYHPFTSPFVFTGITCSEWNNATNIDMSFEFIGGRAYIFYTKGAPADASLAPVGTANDRVGSSFVSGIVLNFKDTNFDPSKVNLKFVGLNGQSSDQNNQLILDQFKQAAPTVEEPKSSNIWIWVLVAVVVLVIIGAVVFLYLNNKTSGSSSSGTYQTPTGNDKDDLEDIRL